MRAWLAARGYDTYGDSVAIPIGERGEDGRRQVRRVRIKYLDKGFDRLERVKSSFSDAWILGLASQLDHVAAGFVDHYRRLQQKKRDRDDINTTNTNTNTKEIDNEERALQSMAGDIFFCLDKAARTRHTLNPELLSTFLSEAFWTSFTSRHDNARTEMARAGIDVAAVLAKHRDEKALREHEEMLKMFGGGDAGVVAEQPGPFEGMRTLGDGGNTKSVYSIASSSGYDKMLPPPPPLPPTVPDVPAPLRRLQRLRRPQGAEGGGGGGGKRASKRKPVIPERTVSLPKGPSSKDSRRRDNDEKGSDVNSAHNAERTSLHPLPLRINPTKSASAAVTPARPSRFTEDMTSESDVRLTTLLNSMLEDDKWT